MWQKLYTHTYYWFLIVMEEVQTYYSLTSVYYTSWITPWCAWISARMPKNTQKWLSSPLRGALGIADPLHKPHHNYRESPKGPFIRTWIKRKVTICHSPQSHLPTWNTFTTCCFALEATLQFWKEERHLISPIGIYVPSPASRTQG